MLLSRTGIFFFLAIFNCEHGATQFRAHFSFVALDTKKTFQLINHLLKVSLRLFDWTESPSQLFYGPLSYVYGRRRVLLIGLFTFYFRFRLAVIFSRLFLSFNTRSTKFEGLVAAVNLL